MEAEQANREYAEFIDSLYDDAPIVLMREIFDGTIRCFSDGRVERLLETGDWREVPHTPNDGNGYNRININGKLYKRSRLIAFAFLGLENLDGKICKMIADHISGNTLDDSISNLRVITVDQNNRNTNSKCYSWHKGNQKWTVQLKIDGKLKTFEYFANESDAKARAIELKLQYYPEFRPRHAYNLANGL